MAPAAAAAAAHERAVRLQAEEEEMTPYTQEGLADDWEFKIVRANTNVFRNPAKLDQLQQEESRAGWVMVEKFDDQRVRFKRPRSARLKDSQLPAGSDPYRVQFGMSPIRFGILLTLLILAITLGIIAVIFVAVGPH